MEHAVFSFVIDELLDFGEDLSFGVLDFVGVEEKDQFNGAQDSFWQIYFKQKHAEFLNANGNVKCKCS